MSDENGTLTAATAPRTKTAIDTGVEKPVPLVVIAENIPPELTVLKQWVAWRYIWRKDKWTKPPINPKTGQLAKSTDPDTWGSFQDAMGLYNRGRADGIGFVVNGIGIVGIDLDSCRNPDTGEIGEEAEGIVRDFAAYSEVSASGTGIRIFCRGVMPENGRKVGDKEFFQSDKYLTVTGHKMNGCPDSIEQRQPQLDSFYARYFAKKQAETNGTHTSTLFNSVSDNDIITKASAAANGTKFSALWSGNADAHGGDDSAADLALCSLLAFYTGPDAARIGALFRRSGLYREKWERTDYRERTIAKALAGRTEFYTWTGKQAHHNAGGTGDENYDEKRQKNENENPGEPWESPIPFPDEITLPPFPTDCLPPWMADYISAEALATQTPPDLAAMLILGVAGAALAKKIKVVIRPGWTEPLNIYVACALFTGERKSAVFADVLRPVQEHECQEIERMAPIIAEAASEHRQLEAQLKHTESKAAKESDENERQLLKHEAKELAKQVALHIVPSVPQMTVDDCTPEAVVKVMGAQGGRILQAAPEGTLFEIAKGRYSETSNFDVYLKGHAGDPLRENRVSRDGGNLPEAVLSVAVAIQPDVIRGLADDPTMRARGFLGRFLYSLPTSRVGARTIASAAVPTNLADKYHQHMLALWRTEGVVDEQGKPAPILLHFSLEADLALQEFERWLEPQLAPEGELGDMAGWSNKLAGAIARLAGILHVAYAAEIGQSFTRPIDADIVENAIVIGRDYLLAHAQAAFALMATDKKQNDAARVIKWLTNSVNSVNSVNGVGLFKIRASWREVEPAGSPAPPLADADASKHEPEF